MSDLIYKKKINKDVINNIYIPINSIPKVIIINLYDIIDIYKIDKIVKHKFLAEKNNLENYIQKLKEKQNLYNNLNKKIHKKLLEKEISNLEIQINNIKNNLKLNEYINNSKKFIDEYIKDPNDKININNYIKEVKKYINIKINNKKLEKYTCKNCNKELNENNDEILDNNYICKECNILNDFIEIENYNCDYENFHTCIEKDIEKFIEILDKFEGIRISYTPGILFEQLNNYFKKINFIDREKVKTSNINEDLYIIMIDALINTNNRNLIDELNSIVSNYWHLPQKKLGIYREKVIAFHKKVQKIWNKIKIKYDRKTSPNNQFRTYVELRQVGYNIKKEYFLLQNSIDSIKEHNAIFQEIFNILNLHYEYIN